MTQGTLEPILTAVFVDYDNIYLSLKKRNEEAAKRFAKDASAWIKEIEAGRIITATNSPGTERPRRIVLNRCYGNPVPRRNSHDNSTDMNSFPFVRHHFLRAGFEVIDCPPLTAQLKNSSDIKMVMDVRDFLNHETRFEEFIILSGDADFTPVLHRLRAHARRTVIFANDFTAAPYTAICDGEVRESHLLSALLEGKIAAEPAKTQIAAEPAALPLAPAAIAPTLPSMDRLRAEIITTVVTYVRSAGGPVPLEALAERTTRALGHDRTVVTGWAGAGSFLELLRSDLPKDIKLTEQPPYLAYDASRLLTRQKAAPSVEQRERVEAPIQRAPQELVQKPAVPAAVAPRIESSFLQPKPQPAIVAAPQISVATAAQPILMAAPVAPPPLAPPAPPRQPDMASIIQQSIARIHEACQAPPLSPPEYRDLFELIAKEITDQGLQGAQTLSNISAASQERGISLSRDDIRFIMEVVSEADPWFEQGASAVLFAGRFRNFVVARCRSQGLNLSSDELDLIEAWFAGGGQQPVPQHARPQAEAAVKQAASSGTGLWGEPAGTDASAEEFPKILRTRLRN